VDAVDSRELHFAHRHPTDNLVPDGLLRGETRGSGFVGGSGIGAKRSSGFSGGSTTGPAFGRDEGDSVLYSFSLSGTTANTVLLLRYRMDGHASVVLQLDNSVHIDLELTGTGDFTVKHIQLGRLRGGEEHLLWLTSKGGASIELDGFAFVEADRAGGVSFAPVVWEHVPKIIPGAKSYETPWASNQIRGEERPVCQLNTIYPARGYIQYVNFLAKSGCSKSVPKGHLIEAKRVLVRAKADSRN